MNRRTMMRETMVRGLKRMWVLGLLVPAVPSHAVSSSAASSSAVPSSAVHDVHVSHMRLVVEGRTVAAQVRLFHDDLQDAVRAHARAPQLVLSSAAGDSAFARYFAQGVGVTADGVRLVPRLLQARDERDAGGIPMRVYTVELTAARPVRRLALRDALLFEHFRDQQNLAVVVRMPSERRTSLFFAAGDTKEQAVPE
ncbi:DUF6702 family protein [Roseisolibacter agri]|nr:DUF6702 family protein [Roseisolibacter agri]